MAISVGVVREYDTEKGIGIIEQANGAGVTVYSSAVVHSGLQTLHEGQRVGFLVVDSGEFFQAENIVLLESS